MIERLGPDDLDACLALATSRGWRPERRRWELLHAHGAVYGIRDDDGLAGCVTLMRYGDAVAAIGMMLVAAHRERQGLGRRLMEHVLAAAGDATVVLYATPFGRPLYERLGFRTVSMTTTCAGRFAGPAAGASRRATAADATAIAALDTAAFGADRGPLLRDFLAFADEVRVLERDGAVRGYGAIAARNGAAVAGPLVAPDGAGARALIADLAAPLDVPVRLDLDHRHEGLLPWAVERGVAPGDDTALMVLGDRPVPGDRERLILPLMLAVG